MEQLLKRNENENNELVRMLGQKISVERKALKIRHFEDITNGFTPLR